MIKCTVAWREGLVVRERIAGLVIWVTGVKKWVRQNCERGNTSKSVRSEGESLWTKSSAWRARKLFAFLGLTPAGASQEGWLLDFAKSCC